MMTASGPPRLNEHLTGICSLSMGQSRIKMTIVPAAGSMSVTAMFRQQFAAARDWRPQIASGL